MKKLILISAMLLLLCSCGSSGKGIKAGETIATNQQCLAASSQDSFDKLNKVCNRKDSQEPVSYTHLTLPTNSLV